MQIDFHHGVTYVVARSAGFSHEDAEIIAYSAQYVDDAVNHGTIKFDNGAIFNRNSSAHKMLDYRNMEQLGNAQCWVSFHFLPGNGGKKAGENPQGSFVNKLECTPNSYVAQEMLDDCLEKKHKPYAKQLLGITMHVFADTFAHQGFVGINHDFNDVYDVDVINDVPHTTWKQKVGDFFGDLWDDVKSGFVGEALPLGHGSVLSFPDLPYLHWRFKRRRNGVEVERKNDELFIDAAEHMCRYMQRWQGIEETGLKAQDREQILRLFREVVYENPETRHRRWLQEIGAGIFSFGEQSLEYVGQGEGSWKYQAIGEISKDKTHAFTPAFLESNWKRFHDALLAHRFAVIHEILPRYGICAA